TIHPATPTPDDMQTRVERFIHETALRKTMVTAPGNFTLSYIAVIDTDVPPCALPEDPNRILGPTQSITYTCQLEMATIDFTHTVVAEGSPPFGRFVENEAQIAIETINPAISIVKEPSSLTVQPNSTITFTIKATNIGDVPLTGIIITDTHTPACERTTPATLQPGEFISYLCTETVATTDIRTASHMQALSPLGVLMHEVATATVDVVLPAIQLDVEPAVQTIAISSTAAFTIHVTNLGNADLISATINASVPISAGCHNQFATLAIGQQETYTCVVDDVTSSFVNSIAVTATTVMTPWINQVVEDHADASVDAIVFASLRGRAWDDLNADSVLDEPELGLADVTVQLVNVQQDANMAALYRSLFSTQQNLSGARETQTDANGHYQFEQLIPGDYVVQVSLTDDLRVSPIITQTSGSTVTRPISSFDNVINVIDVQTGQSPVYTLIGGNPITNVNIALYQPATIGDRVWYDGNLNGVVDGTEGGIANVQVHLYHPSIVMTTVTRTVLMTETTVTTEAVNMTENMTGTILVTDTLIITSTVVEIQRSGLLQSTTTDSNGFYQFTDLLPATYQLEVLKPTDAYLFSPTGLFSSVITGTGHSPTFTVQSGTRADSWDAGFYRLPLIRGRLWQDTDFNGLRTSNEEALFTHVGNQVVRLYAITKNPQVETQVGATATSAEGAYAFTDLITGTYRLRFQLPTNGVFASLQDVGTDDTADSDVQFSGETARYVIGESSDYTHVDAGVTIVERSNPTSDNILTMRSIPYQDAILLTWISTIDPSIRGYHIWRGTVNDRSLAELQTLQVIPAVSQDSSNPMIGAQYHWLDIQADEDVGYFYWIQAISTDGRVQESGPLFSKVDPASSISVWRLWLPFIAQ
ncbi:MAG: SdrD B-like domain-containing protein, partial [Chloroflexota bacterium]